MNCYVEQRRTITPDEAVFSIDFIRGREHEAFLEMERALPYGCVIIYLGVAIQRPVVDHGDGLFLPGLLYYRLNVRILLPEVHA